jgi:hypothetical protein
VSFTIFKVKIILNFYLIFSWCGILGAFSLLLDASTDEAITELILNKMQKLGNALITVHI